MTTQTLIKKLNKEVYTLRKDVERVLTLRRDVRDIKNILLMPSSDPEGAYRKSFVKKVLARAKEKNVWQFTTKEEFLRRIHGRKK